MRILERSAGVLTNYEVYRLLESEARRAATDRELLNGARRTAPHVSLSAHRNLLAVREQLSRYLEQSPSASQTDSQVEQFCERIESFGLTVAEKMQLINLRPTSLVELILIVDECEHRYDKARIRELLDACSTCFPESKRVQQPMDSAPDLDDGGDGDVAEMDASAL